MKGKTTAGGGNGYLDGTGFGFGKYLYGTAVQVEPSAVSLSA